MNLASLKEKRGASLGMSLGTMIESMTPVSGGSVEISLLDIGPVLHLHGKCSSSTQQQHRRSDQCVQFAIYFCRSVGGAEKELANYVGSSGAFVFLAQFSSSPLIPPLKGNLSAPGWPWLRPL